MWDALAGSSGQTWAALRDFWLSELTPHTARSYRVAVRGFFAFCPRPPEEVLRQEVRAWIEWMRVDRDEATVKARLAGLSAWYRWLGAWGEDGLVRRNPCQGVQTGRIEMYARAREPITQEQLRRMLAVASPRMRAWCLLHVLTLMRRSEVAGMREGDFHRARGCWWATVWAKGRKRREVEIPGPAVDALEAWLGRNLEAKVGQSDPSVPESIWGCSPGTLVRELKRTAETAGLEPEVVHVHALRHLGACLLREHGADVGEIQARLGHASPATTMIYLQHLEVRRDTRADFIARDLLG